jgi:hypothetical protein
MPPLSTEFIEGIKKSYRWGVALLQRTFSFHATGCDATDPLGLFVDQLHSGSGVRAR